MSTTSTSDRGRREALASHGSTCGPASGRGTTVQRRRCVPGLRSALTTPDPTVGHALLEVVPERTKSAPPAAWSDVAADLHVARQRARLDAADGRASSPSRPLARLERCLERIDRDRALPDGEPPEDRRSQPVHTVCVQLGVMADKSAVLPRCLQEGAWRKAIDDLMADPRYTVRFVNR